MHGLFTCYILVHVNDQTMAPGNIHIAKTTTQYAHIIYVLCTVLEHAHGQNRTLYAISTQF